MSQSRHELGIRGTHKAFTGADLDLSEVLIRVTVRQAIDEFLLDRRMRNCTSDTLKWYRGNFSRSIERYADLHLEELTVAHVRGIVAEMMDAGKAARTINGMMQATRALINWATDEGIATRLNPRRLKRLKEPEFVPPRLTEEEIQRLIAVPDTRTFLGKRDRMVLLVLLDTACRSGELCGLDVGDLSLPLAKLRGKGRKERIVSLSPPCQGEMVRWLRVHEALCADKAPLFPSRKAPWRLRREALRKIVARYTEQAGIGRLGPHALRHVFASHFLAQGGSLVHLQQILGVDGALNGRHYGGV